MDLADAVLIRIAEREGIRKIFTVDKRDSAVYRIHGRMRPTIIPSSKPDAVLSASENEGCDALVRP